MYFYTISYIELRYAVDRSTWNVTEGDHVP